MRLRAMYGYRSPATLVAGIRQSLYPTSSRGQYYHAWRPMLLLEDGYRVISSYGDWAVAIVAALSARALQMPLRAGQS